MRKITEVILHCSATKEGKDYTVEDIDKWHKNRGWQGIGYHYVIYRDGSVHAGRALEKIGAHCLHHNANSIGICYIGGLDENGKPKDTRTKEQYEAMHNLVDSIVKLYHGCKVYGHNEFANKACPCFDVAQEFGMYR